jgi:hypothetical protein
MIYFFYNKNNPLLNILEINIQASIIADTYLSFRWDSDDKILKVKLNRELILEEKLILDNLVENI